MTPTEVHRRLLEQWRGTMDLVGPGSADEHFEDAEFAVAPLHATGQWVDLGSGAGFPGIALATRFPDAQVTLVERRDKRAAFLEVVAGSCGLRNIRVVHGDAERLDSGWDGVISRAFRTPGRVAEIAERLLKPTGRLVVLLARERPEFAGWRVVQEFEYTVVGKPRAVRVYTRG